MKASVGHVMDLPKSKIGVDIENDFEPEYEVIRGKGKVLRRSPKPAKTVDDVYLAPDPDREGEAIAWHIAEEIRGSKQGTMHSASNEITEIRDPGGRSTRPPARSSERSTP